VSSVNATVSTDSDLITPFARKVSAADASPTILSRTRIFASKSEAAIAAKSGLTESRYNLIERGIIAPSASEQIAIRKAVGSSSPVLFEKQTAETRARENGRF
jgi:transcriptional regulator with XRE-family HTH domain